MADISSPRGPDPTEGFASINTTDRTGRGGQTPMAGDVHGPGLSGDTGGAAQLGDIHVERVEGPAAIGPGAQMHYEHHEHYTASTIAQSLHGLPAAPADFTGREAELKDFFAHIDQGVSISVLRGLGGIGKTALALKLAERLKDRYPDAQFFIDLQGTQETPLASSDAMRQVVRACLGVKADLPDSDRELASLYRSVLDGKRALLLFDNARDAAQVAPLLPPASCGVLVTSRWHFSLPGLYASDLSALPEADAVRLALAIAPRIGDQSVELAQVCGYLPLALRITASALAQRMSLSIGDYLQRLSDSSREHELSEVQATLKLSLDLLEIKLQGRFAQLGVFPAPFDRSAAAAIWGDEPEAPGTQDALDTLVDFSLLGWDAERARYSLHDLVRKDARSRLSAEERCQVSYRHAEHYKDVVSAADALYLQGSEQVISGLALFDREWAHIQAGHDWCVAHANKPDAARLVVLYSEAGEYCLDLRLHARQQVNWFTAAVDSSRQLGDRAGEGNALGNLGTCYAQLGETRKAMELYEQALVIDRETGDRHSEGQDLGNLGTCYALLGEPHKAIALYEQQLSIARETGDRRGEGNILSNLGNRYTNLGEPRHAIGFFEQALSIVRETGDRRIEGDILNNLGNPYAALGEPRRAIEFYEQALSIAREIGDRRVEGNAIGNLGNRYADLGEPRRAIEFYEQALSIDREIGDYRAEGKDLGNLGACYAQLGEPHRAIELYEQALIINRETGDRHAESNSLGNLGTCYAQLGESHRAIELYKQRLVIALEIGDRWGEAFVSWKLGDELAKRGETLQGADLMQVYVDHLIEINHPDALECQRHVEAIRKKKSWITKIASWFTSWRS